MLASHHDGKELNSPNDVVVKSDGGIYFSDPDLWPQRVLRQSAPAAAATFAASTGPSPSADKLTLLADDFGAAERALLLAR